MKEIPLTKGYVALVDDEDFEALSAYRWHALKGRNGKKYAISYPRRSGKTIYVYMHRLVLRAAPGILVDHINHNGLDNRRVNLRLATNAENSANRVKPACNTSGYKGVFPCTTGGRWFARVQKKYLGTFPTPESAARAYDTAATKMYGEFALKNFNE